VLWWKYMPCYQAWAAKFMAERLHLPISPDQPAWAFRLNQLAGVITMSTIAFVWPQLMAFPRYFSIRRITKEVLTVEPVLPVGGLRVRAVGGNAQLPQHCWSKADQPPDTAANR